MQVSGFRIYFLEPGYFFSKILSEFRKKIVALQQLIQGKQRMNMVIIGFLAAPAVLGDVNRIGDIQSGFFRFQLI